MGGPARPHRLRALATAGEPRLGRRMPRNKTRVTAQDIKRSEGGVSGFVKEKIKAADSGDAEAKQAACAQLRSLAQQNNGEHCSTLVGAGAVRVLVKLLTEGSAKAQEYAAGALAAIGLVNDDHQRRVVSSGGVIPLVKLLKTGSAKVQEEVRTSHAQ